MSVLDAENQLEFLQSNPRIATTENIPSLIYLNITGNEEIKKLTSSLLKSVVLNALLVTQFQEFEFEQEAHPSQEKKIRKIWTPPASPENIENLPLADLSLHYFFFKSGFLPDSALLESLKVLNAIYKRESFIPSTRVMLDTLLYVPLFMDKDEEQHALGYQLLNAVSKRAEKECNTKVITCAQSLFCLFPETH